MLIDRLWGKVNYFKYLAIKSWSWLTRKEGGREATPPCGIVINSLIVISVIIIRCVLNAELWCACLQNTEYRHLHTAHWATNMWVSRPTCISGNGSQEFSPLWQQFEKDTADKKTIIIYKCILCQCWLQNDVDDKLMMLLMTFVMVVTIKMMTIIMMVDNRNNDERSLHQKTNCVWAREQLWTMFWSAVEQTWVFRQWRWWR